MLDFNTKKEMLRRLKARRSKNKLMWLPCVTAEIFIKLWYAFLCRADLALSDKNGNFLGVKKPKEKAKARRQDDIVYVKRPFWGRVMSAVLAVSFVLMFVPELGLELNIFAADVSAYITVGGVDYYFHPEGSTADVRYYYPKALYDYAVNANVAQATDPRYLISNSAVRIFWNQFIMSAPAGLEGDINFQGYDIRVYRKGSGALLYTGKATSDATQFDLDKSVFSDTNDSTEYAVAVVPRFKIRRYRLEGATIDPGTGDVIGEASMSRLEQIDFDVTSNNETCKYEDIGFLNAALDIPQLQPIENSTGGAITLKWSPVMQNGGKPDSSNRYADGYAIYRKVVSASNTSYTKIGETDAAVGADGFITFTDSSSVQYGTHYKYFIEAYKIIWDDTGRRNYNTNNYGMITSSGSRTRETADQKASTVYASYIRDAYVAPYRPNLEVKAEPSSNSIKLTWSPVRGRGENDGVIIYRSIGMIDPENIPEVKDGTISFGEWIRAQANLDGGGQYEVKGVERIYFPNNVTTYNDTDIIESVNYWYYVMTYLEKEDATYLYSTPARASSILSLNLEDTTITTTPGDGKIDLRWTPVNGAQGYVLKITQNSRYDILTDTVVPLENPIEKTIDLKNVTSYSHTRLYNGEQYTYSVMPYINIPASGTGGVENKFYGDYCEPRTERAGLPISAPLDVTATTKDGEATVTWGAVSGATGYTLHWENTTKGTKGEITGIPASRTSNTQTMLSNGDVYKYYVVAYKVINGDRGDQTIKSNPSNTVPIKIGLDLSTPQDLKATTKDGEVTLTWGSVPGAEGYTLYYRKNGETAFQKFDNLSKTTFTQTGLKNGDVYTYYVTAYKMVSGERKDSIESTSVSIKVGQALTTPQNLKATTTDGTVNISWNAVAGASGYKLHYKYIKKNGETSDYTDKTVFDVTSTTYVHSGLNNGDRYTYYVEAYKEVSGEQVIGPKSDEVWVIVGVPLNAPKDFSGTTKDGIVDLKWTAVKGAEGYILYFRKNGGAWEEVDISKTSFQHAGLNNGDRYEYYVKSYKTVNGERIFSFDESNHLNFTIGDELGSPKDFNAVTTDGQVSLTWTAVKGAEGYIVYAYGGGRSYQFDVSRPNYLHTGLLNGDSWTYYVVAYKTVNGTRVYSSPTRSVTVTAGVSLNSVIDLVATAGNRQIDLSWAAVKGAEGYVVYLYNTKTMEFEPITVISGTKFSHTGLKNGQKYTYMVAPYKTINGERFYGEYSMSVSATPSTGSLTDIDSNLNVKGTTPYGISHSEYINASANHAAFDESVDVYFTTNRESTEAVKDVLKNYADGLNSFIIYPFDISVYREGTKIEVDPNSGFSVTITMPIPDRLIAYRDYITVVHVGDGLEDTDEISANSAEDWIRTADTALEVLPSAVVDIDNVWCIQFVCTSFSPYAFVIYKEHILDVSSGGGIINGDFAGTFNSGVLLFTALPDIMPNNRRLKVVQSGKKRYRIKSVEKR